MFTLDSSDLQSLTGDFEDIITEGIKETMVEVQARIARDTPVDTGLARANWQVSKNNPATGVLPIGSANAVALRAAIGINYTIGATYYITNNVDYIYYVNNGTANRAGDFFIENAISSVLRRLNQRVF